MAIRHKEGREPSKDIVVFVEGADECNVFASILSEINIEDIEIISVGGKDKLADQFKSAVMTPGFSKVRSFGIVQDADDDSAAAFDRVRDVLTTNKFIAPKSSGTVVESGERKVGILILPGGDRKGYLEDLFLDAYKGTPVDACVDSFAACSEATGCKPFDSKRLAYVFLAAFDAPEPRLGRAFESGKVNGSHSSFDVIRDFLKQLI